MCVCVNVSVEHYLFAFGTFQCGIFANSVIILAQALQKDFYDMDPTVQNPTHNI